MRLWPRSLFGQVMASVTLAVLTAQAISAVLLYRAGEDRREAAALTTAAFQLANGAERAARRQALLDDLADAMIFGDENPRLPLLDAPADREMRGRRSAGRGGRVPPRLRYIVTPDAPIAFSEFEAKSERDAKLRDLLAQQGIEAHRVATVMRKGGDDPVMRSYARQRPRFAARTRWRESALLVATLQRADGGPWETTRVPVGGDETRPFLPALFQTLVIFAAIIAVLFVVLRRITRPLAALRGRVERFAATQDAATPLAPSGPADVRDLIEAHNALEARIAALLDEKDVMLGAIGHDLKTPLAALRVRIEGIEDEAARMKMAAGIDDIATSLDDILALARIGRPDTPPEPAQLGALVTGIVEEYEDMGKPVALERSERIVVPVHVTWIRRAVRNLVSNAVRYGGSAGVALFREEVDDASFAVIAVEDNGPGIAQEQIAAMLEPFARGEGSRNRATGGAGLGLTIARAIADAHGGRLELSNRDGGGLSAQLWLPL